MVPQKIMVVNDDTQFLRMMDLILSESEYEVKTLFEAGPAFEQICAWMPDLVIMDVRMATPEDGLDIIEMMRLSSPTVEIPVIVCSADHDRMRGMEEHLRTENCWVLLKPFNLNTLNSLVHEVIGPA
ncbi:MAG: response regulator transcription factor [Chloroflexia bacterium]|jgi:DNA-binding NtrC family response regulator|nr:response regulator transcription factor [Chloroflexia bacterium]